MYLRYYPQRPLGHLFGKRCWGKVEFKKGEFSGEKDFEGDDMDKVLSKIRAFLKQLQTQKEAIDAHA